MLTGGLDLEPGREDASSVNGVDEAMALEQVREGLSARFPTVAPATVRAVVDDAYAVLDGPVRDYVPLLVERVSRDRLRELSKRAGDRERLVGSGPGRG